jgi:hypothetical protein
LRTPQGVWLIDLLSGSGTVLNGQSLRWTLVKEGDQLQVGPYVLRVWYPEVDTETPSANLVPVEIPAEMPVQAEDGTSEAGQPPSQSHEVLEPAGTDVSLGAPVLQSDLEDIRERMRDAEILRQQLGDSQAQCDRLREQARTLEAELAEAAGLQARLEAAEVRAAELEVVSRERDQWRVEVQSLQDRLASDSVEREELRQRLEALQLRLNEERESVFAAEARVEKESATLQQVREEFAARNAEYDAALHRLQETQDEIARSQDEARSLRTILDHTLEGQKEVESLTLQLADARAEHTQLCARLSEIESQANATAPLEARPRDAGTEMEQLRVQLRETEFRGTEVESVRAECDRLHEQAHALEAQVAEVAGLQARLEAAEASVGELESVRAECDRIRQQAHALEAQLAEVAGLQSRMEAAEASAAELEVVRRERDQWKAEVQNLQDRLASDSANQEELRRLVGEVNAAREGRDRMQNEQQMARQSAEQAWSRVSELERAQTEAAAAHESALQEAGVRWESERQAMEARLGLEGQTQPSSVEDAVRDVQVQAAAEREQWRQLLQGAESQLLWERGMFQEQSEQSRRQVASLQAERDRLAAQLAQAQSRRSAEQERSSDEAGHQAEPEPMRPQAAQHQQPLVQASGNPPAHLPAQPSRTQNADAPAEQAFPQPVLMRERGTAEEQRRLNAIAQEIQAAWGEAPSAEERLPVIAIPLHRTEEQSSEGSLGTDQARAVAHSSAPPAPLASPAVVEEDSAASDTPPGSAASQATQSGDDPHTSLPSGKYSPGEARWWLWRQILGYVRGK